MSGSKDFTKTLIDYELQFIQKSPKSSASSSRSASPTPKHEPKKKHWGYIETKEICPPSEWYKEYPIARDGVDGVFRQSPINIDTESVEIPMLGDNWKPLVWKYNDECLTVKNNGHSWKVQVDGTGSALKGGPLKDEYGLKQFHAHWGHDSSQGSEHTVDGKSFAAELHFVHWNKSRYSTFKEAVDHEDGLAVLGLLVEVGDKDHPELAKLIPYLEKIKDPKGPLVEIRDSDSITPAKFLPESEEDKKFWTYSGSLTTPPLKQCVNWIIFQTPIQVSEYQLEVMRKMFFTSGEEDKDPCPMCDNFRPTVEVGSRKVYEMAQPLPKSFLK